MKLPLKHLLSLLFCMSAGFKVGFRYDMAIQPMVMPSMPEASVGGLLQTFLNRARRQ